MRRTRRDGFGSTRAPSDECFFAITVLSPVAATADRDVTACPFLCPLVPDNSISACVAAREPRASCTAPVAAWRRRWQPRLAAERPLLPCLASLHVPRVLFPSAAACRRPRGTGCPAVSSRSRRCLSSAAPTGPYFRDPRVNRHCSRRCATVSCCCCCYERRGGGRALAEPAPGAVSAASPLPPSHSSRWWGLRGGELR